MDLLKLHIEKENGKVTDTVLYISAIEEGRYTIAQANAQLDEDNRFTGELIPVRQAGEIGLLDLRILN